MATSVTYATAHTSTVAWYWHQHLGKRVPPAPWYFNKSLSAHQYVVHGDQRDARHGPHQHKDQPGTVAEGRRVLVLDAESQCLEHLLACPVYQRDRYDVLDDRTSV